MNEMNLYVSIKYFILI